VAASLTLAILSFSYGAPLIVAWQIRAPIPSSNGGKRKLFGFMEREGRVINVFTADGHPITLPR